MDMQVAKEVISGRVYAASVVYFEQLQNAGLVNGNGLYMAQKVAKFAENLLVERWDTSKDRLDS